MPQDYYTIHGCMLEAQGTEVKPLSAHIFDVDAGTL
jgi:hypothetical protein